LQAGGYKVGLYTSPHLLDYVERIRINNEPISHEQMVELVEEIKAAVAKIPKLTTFEITTALGFLAFARTDVTAAVIEVGLGGRLDATNIVFPRVCVITSLSYDHMAVLGDTLAKIAGEKAGIIKEGVPVISAPQTEEALEVLERVANEKSCPFILIGKDIKFERLASSLDGQKMTVALSGAERSRSVHIRLAIPLLGEHQVQNAAIAYAALKISGIPISDEAIQKGFSEVKWQARFEVVRRDPPLIFDSAHNQHSFLKLRNTLEEHFPGRMVTLIFGASEDKNVPGMFAEMKPKIKKLIVTRADHPRALEPEKIIELADQAGLDAEREAVSPVEAALERALAISEKDGSIVLSAGSMFVTAEVMKAWNKIEMSLRGAAPRRGDL
jgi:dihydrofolate synthase/folylpolyglutamate synthase